MAKKTSTLRLRRSSDGLLSIEGDAPERHIFVGQTIARELETGGVAVFLQIGGHVYELEGFEPMDPDAEESRPNFGAWIMQLTKGEYDG